MNRTYLSILRNKLNPVSNSTFSVVDLFCGAGGVSLGFESAGGKTLGFDSQETAVATYNANLLGTAVTRRLDSSFICPTADVIVAGPPCQPYSVVGNQLGKNDDRDGFPILITAVDQVRPKIVVIENVANLSKHTNHLDWVLSSLKCLGYQVEWKLFDMSEYGVPQKRRRLVILASLAGAVEWPKPMFGQFAVKDAIGLLMKNHSDSSDFLTPSMENYIARYERASKCRVPRDLYPDKPSRTVTCRNLAGRTGDMLRVKLPDGRRRLLTTKEAARLQSFPDWYKFKGSYGQQMTQIGNAVPPLFAYQMAMCVKSMLAKQSFKHAV